MRRGKPRYWVFALLIAIALLPFVIKGYEQACEGYDQTNAEECGCIGIAEASASALFDWLEAYEGAVVGLSTVFLAIFTWRLAVTTERLWDAGERQIGVAKKSADAATMSANVARDALIATRRPLMVLKVKPTLFHAQSSGFGLQAKIMAKNIGATPAIDVAVAIDFIDKDRVGISDEEVIKIFEDLWDTHSEREVIFPDSQSEITDLTRNFGVPKTDHSEWCEFVAWISYGMMFDSRRYYTATFFSLYDKQTTGGVLSPNFRGRLSNKDRLAMIGRSFIT